MNYSILQRNIMHSLAAYDNAEECCTVLLRGWDKNWRLAEEVANEAGYLYPFHNTLIERAFAILLAQGLPDPGPVNPNTVADVRAFMRERHYRMDFPGN